VKDLGTPHGRIPQPTFFPDATRGVIRSLDSTDLEACGVEALMVNTLHLASKPGISVLASTGGIHGFMGWSGPIVSDSGGFQLFSLLNRQGGGGRVSSHGFTYPDNLGKSRERLTPENCIQKQLKMKSDILFCLDHCTHPDTDGETQRRSVEHTVLWARRGKAEFQRWLEQSQSHRSSSEKPLLFAVIQGGSDLDLRRECADRLLEIGFDGYGFGGWPVDGEGNLIDAVAFVSELLPALTPRHALGIGKPENVVRAFKLGYGLFDCVIPTRDARHRRLYRFAESAPSESRDFYETLYLTDHRHRRTDSPIEEGCDCLCCRRYSTAYLHHLFAVEDPLASRLATIHNLRFYSRLIENLREAS
jgi:queuine tRNA-ribosyltransferase